MSAAAGRLGNASKYNFASMSVLIVEDNDFLSKILTQVFHAFGFVDIHSARSVDAAMQILTSAPVDFILCDWDMKPLDGLYLTKQIRSAENESRFAPIIMLTGYTQPSKVKTARDAGVTEFLAKPVSPQTLLDRLVSIIEHPRAFVTGGQYGGPDRRRKKKDYTGADRRAAPVASGGDK